MASPKDNGIFRRNGINYLVPFVLITTLFFLWGFARAILDVLNKHFQNELSISITQSSLIQVTTYLGYFLMAIPAGLFINRYGYRRGVVFGLFWVPWPLYRQKVEASSPLWRASLSSAVVLPFWRQQPIHTVRS